MMENLIATTLLGFVGLVAVGSTFADSPAPQQNSPQTEKPARYWLHPKLGMVRVDPVTLAMLRPARSTEQQAAQTGGANFRPDPKGSIRRLPSDTQSTP